jgi:hypothetical protein
MLYGVKALRTNRPSVKTYVHTKAIDKKTKIIFAVLNDANVISKPLAPISFAMEFLRPKSKNTETNSAEVKKRPYMVISSTVKPRAITEKKSRLAILTPNLLVTVIT